MALICLDPDIFTGEQLAENIMEMSERLVIELISMTLVMKVMEEGLVFRLSYNSVPGSSTD